MCCGQQLTPDPISAHVQQLLFTAGHLKAPGLVELGDEDVVVPQAWDEVAPQRVTCLCSTGKVPCVPHPELPQSHLVLLLPSQREVRTSRG